MLVDAVASCNLPAAAAGGRRERGKDGREERGEAECGRGRALGRKFRGGRAVHAQ